MPPPGPIYSRLPAAVTQREVQATPYPASDDVVKTVLSDITTELLAIQSTTSILGPAPTDPFSPCLLTLHERLETGCPAPFPGLTGSNEYTSERTKKSSLTRVDAPSSERPLGDYEDLYYAMLATVKAMHESLILRLNNGFNDPDAPLYPTSQYSMHMFQEWLLHQWKILNEPHLVQALDNAVRRSLIEHHLYQELLRRVDRGEVTHQEAEEERAKLHDQETFVDMPGLSWIGDEHAGMINGRLNEKYRTLFHEETKVQEKKARWRKKKEKIRRTAVDNRKQNAERGLVQGRKQGQLQLQNVGDQEKHHSNPFSGLDERKSRSGEPDQWMCREASQQQRSIQIHGIYRAPHQQGSTMEQTHGRHQVSSYQDEAQMEHGESDRAQEAQPHQKFALVPQYRDRTSETLPSTMKDHCKMDGVQHDLPTRFHHSHSNPGESYPAERHQGLATDETHFAPGHTGQDMRAQRVSEYRELLRGLASEGARRLMHQRNQSDQGV